MNTTISSHGPHPLKSTGANQNTATPAAAAQSTAAAAPLGSSNPGDRVRLTDSAQALTAAARSGDGSPVNASRVAQLRAAVADGSYRINPDRIADALFRMEQGFGAATTPRP